MAFAISPCYDVAMQAKPAPKTKLTANQALAKLQNIFENVKVDENYIDPYSIKTISIQELVEGKVYNQVADWSCIFNTLYDIFRQYKNEKGDVDKITKAIAKELAQRTHNFLASLPLEYHFLLPVPKGLVLDKDIKITDKISLVKFDEASVKEYEKATPDPPYRKGGLAELLGRTINEQYGKLSVPQIGDTYLKIQSHGYVGSGGCSVYEQDPIYIYKVFFSLNFALGNLERDNSPRNPAVDRFAQFAFRAYTKDKKYASSLTRPDDEAQLINKQAFKKGLDESRIKQVTGFMTPLMTEQKVAANEKLRNQIVNSLFWYFETKKTPNPNLKTVFFTSVFDTYFEQDDRSIDKARMIAVECSSTAGQQELARTEIEKLYKARNAVIHGERPLLDYHIEGKKVNEGESARVEVSMVTFYNRYLSAKLNRFGRSVGIIK